ncbi:FAST kinase domain-containing protein 1, mitochondrial [Callorhinchus milii]|uniref:FAST kinase domains 1 n=1 Tax=Callorhinchus milii TaxID=7868 RepID=A0A4W3I6M4_CALMI|nr:FAST kinase domain-containing protein 1, mitochondrial [Callorhinchus milii]|eukprot:gi/632945655/ref/XP_007888173.1/ PREDICTED: FAST kinase domain-containing protein 1 [Callorhinchus milii]
MLRLRRICFLSMRFFHSRVMGSDPLLDHLDNCTNEDQVFDTIGKNKAKLSVKHVGCAVRLLWQFQKERPQVLRTIDFIKGHSQFMVLRVLAENKIDSMDDETLVDLLYNVLRLNVEPHDSLVQELLVEAWWRIERFSMATLSKFAVCLTEQHMYFSPLMGRIADIVSRKLDSIQDPRILSSLMVSVTSVISTCLRDRLIEKATSLMDTTDPAQFNHSRRMIQFLRNIKFGYRILLEKCNKVFLQNMHQMDVDNISIILGVYQSLHFNNCDFRLAAKQRLTELLDLCPDPVSFTRLFAALGPLAGPEVRERLEADALLMAKEFSPTQALAVVETMEEMECRNPQLIQKVASNLIEHLHLYKPVDISRIAQALVFLHCQNPELYFKLRRILVSYLQISVIPYEVSMLTRVLSLLPSPRMDNLIPARIDAVLPQCNLSDLNSFAIAITKWMRNDSSSRQDMAEGYVKLLQKLNECGLERLQKADSVNLLLEELKYISGEWFEEVLAAKTMATFERLIDQLTWSNVPEFALFLTKTNCLHTTLLDRIASVTLEHINKIHYSATYAILLPFTILNHDPPKSEDFFECCIEHFKPHLSSFNPHLLVLLGYALALADYFPDDLIQTIFSVDFLIKLDAQLETLSDALNMRIRLRLMELNRAVCLECPEFQTPWFHGRYCQQFLSKGNSYASPIQQQIHKILGDILGGINYARSSVITPYYYSIGWECVLDKHNKPLPYVDRDTLLIPKDGRMLWGSHNQLTGETELPPGAQRVAIEFLDSKAFCKNSQHMKGKEVMKKRHLEILGYHVVQIPHFEWNSMELSTKEAWMEYLRKKIFAEES